MLCFDVNFPIPSAFRYVYDKPVLGVFYAKVGVLGFDGEIDIKVKKSGQVFM